MWDAVLETEGREVAPLCPQCGHWFLDWQALAEHSCDAAGANVDALLGIEDPTYEDRLELGFEMLLGFDEEN